jgi:hypothetical protein
MRQKSEQCVGGGGFGLVGWGKNETNKNARVLVRSPKKKKKKKKDRSRRCRQRHQPHRAMLMLPGGKTPFGKLLGGRRKSS